MTEREALDPAIAALDREIVAAHRKADKRRLAELYAAAARLKLGRGLTSEAAFFYVHAYVWALDAGDESIAGEALGYLRAHGREE
jgi:hypothetical protein